MVAYRIAHWERVYENAQSRKLKRTTWVPISNKHDGKGYRRMVAHPKRIELFAGWNLIVQVASKCPMRGYLADEDGPLTAEDMYYKTGFPKEIFDLCFSFFSDPTMGWMEKIGEIEPKTQKRENLPESPRIPRNLGKEGNGIEGNGIKRQLAAKGVPHFAFVINGQQIPGSFWGLVVKKCGGDRELAGRVFFRARNAENMIEYISKGFGKDRYILQPCTMESTDPVEVRCWIDTNILKIQKPVEQRSDSLQAIGNLLQMAGIKEAV